METSTGWTWFVERLTDQQGVWPWAEHNQGLLSVAALIVALAIAVYEVRRAARVESRAADEYVRWVLNCADRSIELTTDAMRTIDEDPSPPDRMPLSLWRFLNGNTVATLEEIQPLRPSHPELAHHVNRLLRTMKMEIVGDDGSPTAREQLEQLRTYVQIGRDHVARLAPSYSRGGFSAFVRLHLRRQRRTTRMTPPSA